MDEGLILSFEKECIYKHETHEVREKADIEARNG
jgi:hypothetical protein